jgi:hypothetical protein
MLLPSGKEVDKPALKEEQMKNSVINAGLK